MSWVLSLVGSWVGSRAGVEVNNKNMNNNDSNNKINNNINRINNNNNNRIDINNNIINDNNNIIIINNNNNKRGEGGVGNIKKGMDMRASIEDEGGVGGKGPSDVAFRWEARRQFGCHATVRKKDDAGGSPAKFRANVNTREASKGKLWAGSDRRLEEKNSRYKVVPVKEQGIKEENKGGGKRGEEEDKERVMGWNENNNIKLKHCEDEGRREGEKERTVVDWVMKRNRKTL